MGDFRASAWDLNVNTKITDLTPYGLTYEDRINDPGTAAVKLDLSDPDVSAQAAAILAYGDNPWKLVITANTDQLILKSAMMTNPKTVSSNLLLDVTGVGLPGYFDQVVLTKDYGTSISPAQLLVNVVADIQAQAGANIGIATAQRLATTPANITPSYKKSAYTTAAQVLSDMTAAVVAGTGGVDYTMIDGWQADAYGVLSPAHTLTVWAPRAGHDSNTSGLVIDLEAAIEWTWPRSNKQTGNQVIVVGGGSGNVQPVATATSSDPIGGQGQAPLLQQVLQYNHITQQSHLQNIANGAVQMWGKPVATPTVKLPADYGPCPLGGFSIGDDVRVRSEPRPQFPTGKDEWWRIVSASADLTAAVPTVELTLNRPPVF